MCVFLDLILCDFCDKAFHLECHIPRLLHIPNGVWQCCECSAASYKKRQRCGECVDCLRPDCGKCTACKRKKKFGGDGKHLKPCKDRKCKNMRFAAPETMPNIGTCPMKSKEMAIKRSGFKSMPNLSSNIESRNSLDLGCPFRRSLKSTSHNGFNCKKYKIVRLKSTSKSTFFDELFRGQTLTIESDLDDSSPERTVTQVSRSFAVRK